MRTFWNNGKYNTRTLAGMTYSEAIAAGYHVADTVTEAGYISRKMDVGAGDVYIAGGRRKGQLYALIPNWNSTRFYYRVYLTK